MLRALFASLLKNKSGVTAIEYALIAALIAVVAIAAFKLVGTNLSNTFTTIANTSEVEKSPLFGRRSTATVLATPTIFVLLSCDWGGARGSVVPATATAPRRPAGIDHQLLGRKRIS